VKGTGCGVVGAHESIDESTSIYMAAIVVALIDIECVVMFQLLSMLVVVNGKIMSYFVSRYFNT